MAPKKINVPRSANEDPPPIPKKRAGRARPPCLTNAEWKREVERSETVTADRKGREERKKAKEVAETERVVAERAVAKWVEVGT